MSQTNHYLDTSVVLSHLLEDGAHLQGLSQLSRVASSRLLWIEVSRGIHRGLQTGRLSVEQATEARHGFISLSDGISQIRLTEEIYREAEGPFPLPIRTLDAIHLASAEIWLRSQGETNPANLALWTLDTRMNHCAAQLGYLTPLMSSS